MRKYYFSHDLRIDSYSTFPRSHATVENLLLGTLCYLSCCGMRYSRIMRTAFLMSCHWKILFQKVKRIATLLLCGKTMSYQSHTWYVRLGKPSIYTTSHRIDFGQTLWPLLRNLSCSQDQDHVHSTYTCCSYTRGAQKHAFHPPKNIVLLHWG